MFRPNLEDRVAVSVLSLGRRARRVTVGKSATDQAA